MSLPSSYHYANQIQNSMPVGQHAHTLLSTESAIAPTPSPASTTGYGNDNANGSTNANTANTANTGFLHSHQPMMHIHSISPSIPRSIPMNITTTSAMPVSANPVALAYPDYFQGQFYPNQHDAPLYLPLVQQTVFLQHSNMHATSQQYVEQHADNRQMSTLAATSSSDGTYVSKPDTLQNSSVVQDIRTVQSPQSNAPTHSQSSSHTHTQPNLQSHSHVQHRSSQQQQHHHHNRGVYRPKYRAVNPNGNGSSDHHTNSTALESASTLNGDTHTENSSSTDTSTRKAPAKKNAALRAGAGSGAGPRSQPHSYRIPHRAYADTRESRRGLEDGQHYDDEEEADYADDDYFNADVADAVLNKNYRKANALINFKYPLHDRLHQRNAANASASASTSHLPAASTTLKRSVSSQSSSVFSRDAFVSANFHFVLSCSAIDEYEKALSNPDHRLDWNAVECVVYPVDSETAKSLHCPICLEPHIAPRVTKCGHIYCYSCALQYLAHQIDRGWAKCICAESIYPNGLKPLFILPLKRIAMGDEMEFILMKRPKDGKVVLSAMVPQKLLEEIPKQNGQLPSEVSLFSRVTLIKDTQWICQRDMLQLQYAAENDNVDNIQEYFLKLAMEDVSRRQEYALLKTNPETNPLTLANLSTGHLLKSVNPPAFQLPSSPNAAASSSQSSQSKKSGPKNWAAIAATKAVKVEKKQEEPFPPLPAASTKKIPEKQTQSTDEKVKEKKDFNEDTDNSLPNHAAATCFSLAYSLSNVPCSDKDSFYFYQAADSQPIFLHSLSYRMLMYEANQMHSPFTSSSLISATTETPNANCDTAANTSNTLPPATVPPLAPFSSSSSSSSPSLSSSSSSLSSAGSVPPLLKCRVIEIVRCLQSDELRRKYRFLSHLPIFCPFALVKVDLSTVVSSATLKHFADELTRDERQRLDKAKALKRKQVEWDRMQKEAHSQHWLTQHPDYEDFDEETVRAYLEKFSAVRPDSDSLDVFPTLTNANTNTILSNNTTNAAALSHTATSNNTSNNSNGNTNGMNSSTAASTSTFNSQSHSPPLTSWKVVAEKGFAASEMWAALPSSAKASQSAHSPNTHSTNPPQTHAANGKANSPAFAPLPSAAVGAGYSSSATTAPAPASASSSSAKANTFSTGSPLTHAMRTTQTSAVSNSAATVGKKIYEVAAGSTIATNAEEKLLDGGDKSIGQSKKQKKGKKQVLLRFG